jgi:hypothetical protein
MRITATPPREAGTWHAGVPLVLGAETRQPGEEVPEAWEWPEGLRWAHIRAGSLVWRAYAGDAAIVAADVARLSSECSRLETQRDALLSEIRELEAEAHKARRLSGELQRIFGGGKGR